MPKKSETFYITTAIPYANDKPHMGHAIEFLYTDIMARYQRLLGNDVYFLSGTDEHGQKMLKTARDAGVKVEDFAAEKSAIFQNLLDQWNISNDDFIRTTEERHIKGAQELWKRVVASDDIYKKSYSGLYCYGCESFKTDKDIIDGKCPLHNRAPEQVSEENYFFRLSKYQEPLQFLFEKNKQFVIPESKYNEMIGVLKAGLEDISVSRSKEKLPWGIPVPGDETQVMYVWFDALSNYITALEFEKNGKLFKKFWPGTHVIGKDINRFHSLLWPAMLMSAGVDVPKQVAVHGFVYAGDGQKMSKTLGNVVDPIELITRFPLEAVRYHLAREIPFDNDGNYSDEKLKERYNSDLANGLGNLTNRILTMIEKYCENVIPEVKNTDDQFINFLSKDIWPVYESAMSGWRFDLALDSAMKFITFCDRQISDKQPWAMAKAGKTEEVNNLLYHLAESLRHIAVMIWPAMPDTAEKIINQLGLDVSKEFAKPLSELKQWVDLTVGSKISKGEPLFPRLLDK
ncbi:MAG: methionine--tRNA ligase [Patescibacteria group bacterium]|jgi:methionyl-tRNA synthetase